MKCSCCGRKKKLLESFENVGKGGDVCADCSDILYRITDAVKERNKEEYQSRIKTIRAYLLKKSSNEFKNWFETDFMERNQFPDNNSSN